MEETVVEPTMDPNFTQTLLSTLQGYLDDGGIFMYVILAVWGVGIVICLERFRKLSKFDVDGPSFMNELQRYILSNDIQGAIRVCSGSLASLPKVLKSALKRSNQKPEQIQNAIDATALEVIPKIELRMPYISLLANISTLLGLLGTIVGMVQSFAALSGDSVDPAQKAELLTQGISKAMYTTALGLMSAISLMVIYTFLSSKSEKIVAEIDEFSVKILDLLTTKNKDEGAA